ncbi:Ribulose-1 [Diplonema papillatum]|nr:Ribulose-1 [Diplonema papillatum]|eukprot:gene2822-4414_t
MAKKMATRDDIRRDAAAACALEEMVDAADGFERKVRISWAGDSKGHGMVAAEPVAKGAAFLKVPRALFFEASPDDDDEDDEDDEVDLPDSLAICLRLLKEKQKGAGSKWVDWIRLLPETFNCIAVWDPSDIAELDPEVRRKMAAQLQKKARESFAKVRAAEPSLTYDDFCWAHSAVETRGFSLESGRLVLLPYADMFNHEADGCASFGLDPTGNFFVFTADRDYEEGEDIALRYNSSAGWDQASYYGFLEPDLAAKGTFPIYLPKVPDTHDALHGTASLSDIDAFRLQAQRDRGETSEFCVTANGPTRHTLRALRIRFVSDADGRGFAEANTRVSLENEWNCWLHVATFCRSALRTFRKEPRAADPSNPRRVLAAALREADVDILRRSLNIARRAHAALAKEILVLADDAQPDPTGSGEAWEAARQLAEEAALLRRIEPS